MAASQPPAGEGGSLSSRTRSRMPSRTSSLLATWLYSDIASKPSTWPSLRMVSASIPPSSARASAARRMRSRLSGRRGSVCVAIDKSYAVRLSYAISLHCTKERRAMTTMAAVQAGTMKAIVRDTYGSPDVLKLGEVEKPDLADDGVLVRVHAASVARGDWYSLTGLYVGRTELGLRKPKSRLIGGDFAG